MIEYEWAQERRDADEGDAREAHEPGCGCVGGVVLGAFAIAIAWALHGCCIDDACRARGGYVHGTDGFDPKGCIAGVYCEDPLLLVCEPDAGTRP